MARIRKAGPQDAALLLPLVADYRAFEGIPPAAPELCAAALQRLLADARLGMAWLAERDGMVVGYLLAVYVFSLEHLGLTAEIDEFFVIPAHRCGGTGSALLQAAEAEFAHIGCTNVSLQLGRNNTVARPFYLKHGFAERSGYELLEKETRAN